MAARLKNERLKSEGLKSEGLKGGRVKDDRLKDEGLKDDERAWADFLITRVGLLLFCTILFISAFNIHPVFIQQDAAGMMDASLSSLASYIEDVDSTSIQGAHYYMFDIDQDVTIDISSKYVSAYSDTKTGRVTRARALMTTFYPPNSLWDSRPGLLEAIAGRCGGRTGLGEDVLEEGDWQSIIEMLDQTGIELAQEPFVVDTMQPLLVEKVMLNIRTAEGVERRGVTIVYQ
ncbi:MAG: hypothetical protein HF976_01760 [ANME-2 cluster archaeon]|nr:hypothetical protein [ANME-2 cluster archaeon]MBC2700135.1 hypothetical protein [ANME-2 cluster archaeon]MBC2708767.1 hypothetical protein [ANME-2 cluster archaeon]MBC2748273.1 hypothetical protein [ANME-2 cluster archaeon]MBC2763385.1 hypothetical protein [ANME-2 cluster archaeon]